jgi:hypothetical protein
VLRNTVTSKDLLPFALAIWFAGAGPMARF